MRLQGDDYVVPEDEEVERAVTVMGGGGSGGGVGSVGGCWRGRWRS